MTHFDPIDLQWRVFFQLDSSVFPQNPLPEMERSLFFIHYPIKPFCNISLLSR